MTPPPPWLPPMVFVSPWTGQTFGMLYEIFERDFKASQPQYQGSPVWSFPEVEDGKDVIFWHLTHRYDRQAGERIPDLRRCERLSWIRRIIENLNKAEVLSWDCREGNQTIKTYLWLKNHDFVVLMKKYPNGSRRLLTSYYVDYPNYRRKLEQKYARRLK